MVSRLDPQRLVILADVERAGSIAGAARLLGYSEATIAHHLRVLERQARAPVTHRRGRTVELTPLGRSLARRGRVIAGELAAAEGDTIAHSDLTTGTLRLSAFPSYCAAILPAVLAEFTNLHPDVEVVLTESEPPEAVENLRAGTSDVAIVFAGDRAIFEGRPWDVRALFDDPLYAVVPATHPAAGAHISLAELSEETWIAGCPRCRQQLVELAAAEGFEPRVRFATDDYLAVQHFVAHGLGVAVLPRLALDNSPDDPRIVTAPLTPPARRVVAALTPTPPTRPAQVFVDLIVAHRSPAQPAPSS